MKALRVFTIINNDDSRERITLKLYREPVDGELLYVWRFDNEYGNPCEQFAPSKTMKDAMENAAASWGNDKIWGMKATWL